MSEIDDTTGASAAPDTNSEHTIPMPIEECVALTRILACITLNQFEVDVDFNLDDVRLLNNWLLTGSQRVLEGMPAIRLPLPNAFVLMPEEVRDALAIVLSHVADDKDDWVAPNAAIVRDWADAILTRDEAGGRAPDTVLQ